jgi:hypothetical protein
MMSRYKDGYRVARKTVLLGTICKTLGAGAGGLIAVYGFLSAQQTNSPYMLLPVFAAAFAVWISLWIMGTFISAQGQLLQAAFDTAVNTCPLLSDSERAEIMSLTV